jgi:carboxypeptidase Taq
MLHASDAIAETGLLERLLLLLRPIVHLAQVAGLLEWDQETTMPRAGSDGRALQLETLAGLRHRLLTSNELHETLLRAQLGDDPELRLHAETALREVMRARRTSSELATRLAGARSRAVALWQQARAANDFGHFASALTELVALRRQQAAEIAGDSSRDPYDVLLEEYEPDIDSATIDSLFAPLLPALVALIDGREPRQPFSSRQPPEVRRCYGPEAQLRLGRLALDAIGFDDDRGRIDLSAHPFCMGLHPEDVRITWRVNEEDFRPGLFGLLHEMGHALYEQGLPVDLRNSPLGTACSMAVHESQSRLWENHVGRSRGFSRWLFPHFKAAFHAAPIGTPEALHDSLVEIGRSLIRVDADELSYHLHIVIRYRLERDLIAGRLEVVDLPAAWNESYRKTLGLVPADDTEGVLQDIHWACGLFGYFPTYTLGSLMAAQLFAAAERDLGALDEGFERGEFAPLLAWLRERVHRHGSRLLARDIVRTATGTGISIDPFLEHARRLAAAPSPVSY